MGGTQPKPAQPDDRAGAEHGDRKARERDPHGKGPGQEIAQADPAGRPSGDREATETAAGPAAGRD